MKDFCKWLGVNEKIAKIVVWILIFMCMLIIFNTAFESLGIPYYKLTVENLIKVNYHKIFDYVLSWIICLLNFYSIIFLIFPVKNFKKIVKWSIVYLFCAILINIMFGYILSQVFIILFCILFAYIFSNKNWKYIFYGILGITFNIFIQYIDYLYKIKYINYNVLNKLNVFILSIDYFIVIFIIVAIKEIYLKKRGEK